MAVYHANTYVRDRSRPVDVWNFFNIINKKNEIKVKAKSKLERNREIKIYSETLSDIF